MRFTVDVEEWKEGRKKIKNWIIIDTVSKTVIYRGSSEKAVNDIADKMNARSEPV